MTGIKKTDPVHIPVLLKETVLALNIQPEMWYVDGTFGWGGHSREIITMGGRVLGLDQDKESINLAKKQFDKEIKEGRLILEQGNFRSLSAYAAKHNLKPEGVLLDLGFSSWQLDQSGRGFTYMRNEPLDMRMDPHNYSVKARDLVNGLYENELAKLIQSYGEDPLAKMIAKQIVKLRKIKAIETTTELAQIIRDVYRHYYHSRSSTDPAAKTFQALRIAVNDEMNALREGLSCAMEILKSGGRVAVISFHGLEDRIVKKMFQDWVEKEEAELFLKKPALPDESELRANSRSHSAKLRVLIKK